MIPYSGTCEQTRKIKRVTAVHRTFWLKGTCGKKMRPAYDERDGKIHALRSGDETSGRMGRKGRTRFRNRTILQSQWWAREMRNLEYLQPLMTDGRSGQRRAFNKLMNAKSSITDVAAYVIHPITRIAKGSTL
jgi:hypothetical protein